VTYYDFRNAGSGPGLPTDSWAVLAKPSSPQNLAGGLTNPGNWNHEVRLTVSSFDMEQAPQAGGLFVGDYTGLTSSGNKFLALFAQAGTNGAGTSAVYSRWFGPFGSVDETAARSDTTQVLIAIDHGNEGGVDPLTPVFGTSRKKGHHGF
jgi:hypothetical protein